MRHKYEVGQMVDLISAPNLSNRPSGPCRIVLRLPFEGERLQYRVQSLAERNQRVVYEDDLRPCTDQAPGLKAKSLFSSVRAVRR